PSSVFTAPASLTLWGDYENNGTFTAGSGLVTVTATSTFEGTMTGASAFNDVEALSAVAEVSGYDVSNGVFDSIALSVASQELIARAMIFNNTGTVLYVMGSSGDDINAYNLSVPYDISSGTFDAIALSVEAQSP